MADPKKVELNKPMSADYKLCKGMIRNPATGHMEEIEFYVHKDHPSVKTDLQHPSVAPEPTPPLPTVAIMKENKK